MVVHEGVGGSRLRQGEQGYIHKEKQQSPSDGSQLHADSQYQGDAQQEECGHDDHVKDLYESRGVRQEGHCIRAVHQEPLGRGSAVDHGIGRLGAEAETEHLVQE
ncbi:hypothetical protein SDC9_211998 [bioreactor metagenome]|uniref:Uncharacterized protein n=1 Tax=bioreactor metagenome TaxID=1076179 RepID=A0A645JLI7_9ZZZZ